MNNQRRKEIKAVEKRVDALLAEYQKAKGNLEKFVNVKDEYDDAKTDLEMLMDEEQCAYDNMSEGLQESDMGYQMQECIDALSEYVDWLTDVVDRMDDLEALTNSIDKAKWNGFFEAIEYLITEKQPSLSCCYY